jgi:hypothetical protein
MAAGPDCGLISAWGNIAGRRDARCIYESKLVSSHQFVNFHNFLFQQNFQSYNALILAPGMLMNL